MKLVQRYGFSPDALAKHPDIAVIVTKIFGHWTAIETEFRLLLARITNTDEGAGNVIFDLLQSNRLQKVALLEVGQKVFRDEDLEIFQAVVEVAHEADSFRNKLAHWLIGQSVELPDAILMVNPKHVRKQRTFQIKTKSDPLFFMKLTYEEFYKNMMLNPADIYVYTKQEFENELDVISQVNEMMFQYAQMLHPVFTESHLAQINAAHLAAGQEAPPLPQSGTSAEARRQLFNLKIFQKALSQLRARKKVAQKAQP